MVPCIDDNIPVYVRNIFNPGFRGTVIQGRSPTMKERDDSAETKRADQNGSLPPIKGITSIDKVALVNLEGASLIGDAPPYFSALSRAPLSFYVLSTERNDPSPHLRTLVGLKCSRTE